MFFDGSLSSFKVWILLPHVRVCTVHRKHSDRCKQHAHRSSQEGCSFSGRLNVCFIQLPGQQNPFSLYNCKLAFHKVTGNISCSLPSLPASGVALLLFALMASKSLHLLGSLFVQSLGQRNHFFISPHNYFLLACMFQ